MTPLSASNHISDAQPGNNVASGSRPKTHVEQIQALAGRKMSLQVSYKDACSSLASCEIGTPGHEMIDPVLCSCLPSSDQLCGVVFAGRQTAGAKGREFEQSLDNFDGRSDDRARLCGVHVNSI